MNGDGFPWYKFYIHAWSGDEKVVEMDFAERGIYRELLDLQWKREGNIPLDAKMLAGLITGEFEKKAPIERFLNEWGSRCFPCIDTPRTPDEHSTDPGWTPDEPRMDPGSVLLGRNPKLWKILQETKQRTSDEQPPRLDEIKQEEKRKEVDPSSSLISPSTKKSGTIAIFDFVSKAYRSRTGDRLGKLEGKQEDTWAKLVDGYEDADVLDAILRWREKQNQDWLKKQRSPIYHFLKDPKEAAEYLDCVRPKEMSDDPRGAKEPVTLLERKPSNEWELRKKRQRQLAIDQEMDHGA